MIRMMRMMRMRMRMRMRMMMMMMVMMMMMMMGAQPREKAVAQASEIWGVQASGRPPGQKFRKETMSARNQWRLCSSLKCKKP